MAIAGVRISSLRELINADQDDFLVINDVSAATTKKIRLDNLLSAATGNVRDSDTGAFTPNLTTNELHVKGAAAIDGDLTTQNISTDTVIFDNLKDVNENITITKFVDAADGIVFNNNDITMPTCAAVKSLVDGTISDYRLKSNVVDYQGGLEKLQNVKVYEYDILGEKEVGTVAHELQEIIPHLVNGEKDAVYEDGKAKYQTVNYIKMVPILLAAIKELKAEIDSLKEMRG